MKIWLQNSITCGDSWDFVGKGVVIVDQSDRSKGVELQANHF